MLRNLFSLAFKFWGSLHEVKLLEIVLCIHHKRQVDLCRILSWHTILDLSSAYTPPVFHPSTESLEIIAYRLSFRIYTIKKHWWKQYVSKPETFENASFWKRFVQARTETKRHTTFVPVQIRASTHAQQIPLVFNVVERFSVGRRKWYENTSVDEIFATLSAENRDFWKRCRGDSRERKQWLWQQQ